MSGQVGFSNCSNPPCPSSAQIKLYQTVIFATPVLFTLVLLLLFCMLYLRRRRIDRVNSELTAQFFTRGVSPTPLENGLSKSFRQTLPTIPFDEKFAAAREDTQCAVCLGDYQLNEKLQRLPVCGHAFHVECIDKWLAKNTTCPLCRLSLIEECREASVNSLAPEGNGIGHGQSATESRRWEDTVMDRGVNNMRAELCNGESSSGMSSVEAAVRVTNEHATNLERS
eukprot:c25263_g1_i1 orf=573-1250(+)